MRTAIYVRVSTVTHSQQHTIEEQINRLRTCLLSRGEATADEHIFRDEGRSGATLNRPALDRLRDQVRLGDYDRILITSPDRLARNYVHQMLLLEELERAGCRVEFLDQPMGDTPHDHLLLQIRGAVAEYERALIGDRMRRGRPARYRAGLLLPWTRPVYGYLLDPERPRDPQGVRVSEAEAAVVRQIFAWYLEEGASLSSIVNRLFAHGVASPSGRPRWRHTTVRFLLRNPAYTGTLYAARTHTCRAQVRRSALAPIGKRNEGVRAPRPREEWVTVGTIPALVTPEQYELVQQKLARNRQFAARNNTAHDYLLRALVSCGLCGLAATGRTAGVGYPYYVCAGKRADGAGGSGRCRSRLTPARQLDGVVWADLCAIIREPRLIALELERAWGGRWLPEELTARREGLRKARAGLGQQVERLTEAYLGGVLDLGEYERRRREIEARTEAFASQERELVQQMGRRHELAGMVGGVEDYCRRVSEGLAGASFEQKRRLVELLIDRVVVTEEEVEIRYVIPMSASGEHARFCHLRTNYLPTNAQKDERWLEVTPFEGIGISFQEYDSR
ncbi:MAG: site-specific recombinase [Acidobacteriota bacterium]|jgi:site-specific DNA recombinase|nr:site-specific recombinase [Acidobacteriota bacterium]